MPCRCSLTGLVAVKCKAEGGRGSDLVDKEVGSGELVAPWPEALVAVAETAAWVARPAVRTRIREVSQRLLSGPTTG